MNRILTTTLCCAALLAPAHALAQADDDLPPIKGRAGASDPRPGPTPDWAKPDEGKPAPDEPAEPEVEVVPEDEPEPEPEPAGDDTADTADTADADAAADADGAPVDELAAADDAGESINLLAGDNDNLLDQDIDIEDIAFENPLLGYVVVTGSKRRMRTTDSLSSLSVLTLDQVEHLPYFFLGDLLSTLPGVDARWGMMQRYYVGIRGLGSTTALNSRLLLLWDGVPMNDPFTGELAAGHFMPLVEVQRIELIRGAGSSMYGANAFSGVINVVTGDPAELSPRPGVRASALLGSFLTSRLQVAAHQPVGAAKFGASVEAFRTDGPFPHIERPTPEGFDEFKNDDVKSIAGEAHVEYEGLELRGQFVAGERGKPGTMITDATGHMRDCTNCHSQTEWGRGEKYPATPHSCGNCHATPDDREEYQRGSAALLYSRWLGGGFKVSAQLYDNEYRTKYKSIKEGPFLTLEEERFDLKQRALGGETYLAHSTKSNNAVVGAAVRHTAAASQLMLTPDGEDTAAFTNVAGFAEEEYSPAKWMTLTAGARADYTPYFGAAFSPRGGVLIKPDERLTVRATAARAFRNPSLSELYVSERRGRYSVSGNPELEREWINALEGGVSYAFQPLDKILIRLGAAGFWNRTTALIGVTATGRAEAGFVNFDAVTIAGSELEADLEIQSKPRVRAFFNYSYQHAKDAGDAPLPYAPASKANLTVMADDDNWTALVRTRVVAERWDEMRVALDPYATIDAAAGFHLGEGVLMSIWANNINADDHQESLGVPSAPRSFFVTLGYEHR